ncbi:MAG: protein kinase [Acidobacteriota bacterium]
MMNPGDKLGPYEILALIGKGGMGEVYRAHGDRLRRDVAIKVSKDQFTERFTREARTIASLNHTNICHLYDVGPNYLVMEYVEGDDLKGPLDFDDALPIIQQLIDGIEAAHEKNIIHRDLKPANIKVTPEGVVKILDFGLAKAMEPPPSHDADPSNSPTLTMGATVAGTILGTAAYMAPEQAKGKAADKRCDIWSFGVVVYEMLTGKRLFHGESVVEILGGVLNKEADISAAPARVHKLLAWCLEKDRKQRLTSISDARRLLREDGTVSPAQAEAHAPPRSPLFTFAPWAVAAILAGVAGWALWPKPAELKSLVRLDLDLNPRPSTVLDSGPILSPDGTTMVYVGNGRLYSRRLDQAESVELAGTQGATGPFFSPDGRSVGFTVGGRFNRVRIDGGGVVAIPSSSTRLRGGAVWTPDDHIISASGTGLAPLVRLPVGGGDAETLGELLRAEGEIGQAYPQLLPGGKTLLYTGFSGAPPGFAVTLSLPGLERKIVQRNAGAARHVVLPDGAHYLLSVNQGNLTAVRFDPTLGSVSGTPITVLNGVQQYPNSAGAAFDVSPNGTLIYQRGPLSGAAFTLQWLDSAGKLTPVLDKPGDYGRPQVSPDGTRLALDHERDVWTYDWKRDLLNRLTFSGANGALWSPDNRFVLFNADTGLQWARADGGGAPQILLPSQTLLYPWSFTPDGKRLAYLDITSAGYDLYTVSVENDGTTLKAGKPEPFLKTPADERYPQFSPDGRWMMYVSDDSGTQQVYVRTFPNSGGKWQISTGGGTYPEWSSDGKTIFFRTRDQQLMTATYTAKGDAFTPEKPRPWTGQRIGEVGLARNYGLHPDGKRAVVVMPAAASGQDIGQEKDATHVTILFNFLDEVQRRAAGQSNQ